MSTRKGRAAARTTEMKECGNCTKQIPAADAECALCGWRDPMGGASARSDARAGRCDFTLNGKRCPLPGTWSDHPSPSSPRWCRIHSGERHADAAAEDELDAILADPLSFLPGRGRDWRDVAIEEIVAEHPEWQRRGDETASAYRARMQQLRRELLAEHQRQSMPGQRIPEGVPHPPSAPSPRPAPFPVRAVAPAPTSAEDADDVVEDALDQLLEIAARHEADGCSTELAQRLAAEEVFRARFTP